MDEKKTWLPTIFARFGQPQTLGQETWPLENSSSRHLLFIYFTSCVPYQLLPQITLSWAKILDQPVHFFTVV